MTAGSNLGARCLLAAALASGCSNSAPPTSAPSAEADSSAAQPDPGPAADNEPVGEANPPSADDHPATGIGSTLGRSGGLSGNYKPPTVRIVSAEVEGPLSRDVVKRIVGRHVNEVRYCYSQTLNRDNSVAGTVTVQASAAADGSVGSSKASGSTGVSELHDCIAGAVDRWKFVETKGESTLRLTFELSPEPQDSAG